MDVLFFKVFSMKINILLHAFKPIIETLFPIRGRYFKTWFLNASAAFSEVKNRGPHISFIIWGIKNVILCQIRAVRRVTHQFDILAFRKFLSLSLCVRACIVMIKTYSPVFQFPKDMANKWLCIIENLRSCVALTSLTLRDP